MSDKNEAKGSAAGTGIGFRYIKQNCEEETEESDLLIDFLKSDEDAYFLLKVYKETDRVGKVHMDKFAYFLDSYKHKG